MMTIEDDVMAFPLSSGTGEAPQAAVLRISDELFSKLRELYSGEYEIKEDEADSSDEGWSREIKIRKGAKIGAAVTIKLGSDRSRQLEVEVEESSKMTTVLLLGVFLPMVFLGMYFSRQDVGFFAHLPGRKLGALLGGLIMVIPGGILFAVVKALVLKPHKQEIESLLTEIRRVVQESFSNDGN